MPIPAFSATNILPPYVGKWPDAPAGFAPYPCQMAELVSSFATSDQRRRILVGLIDLRDRLRKIGIQIVTQWLDGSFVEAVEKSAGRPPGDIDVMTFFRRPTTAKDTASFAPLIHANLDVFNPGLAKAKYHCDHYTSDMDVGPSIETLCYWHSVFSHRRDGAWKGYISIIDEGQQIDIDLRKDLINAGVTQ